MIGTVLVDRYEIIEVIGEGGMGIVYKAKHALMDRIVAIKMLHEDYAGNANALKRFEQEAKAVSSLNHPNILGVYDFGTNEKGQPFLVTEFLTGESLESILASKGKLPQQVAVPIFVQACVGLHHAHHHGVIHRDLKPSNIMLIDYEGQNSFVKVLDFGIAKVLGGDDLKMNTPELTRTGEIFGSPLYMSPEQCKALPLDARSDIYSLGCLMYRTLTGECAINGNNLLEVLYKQVNEQPAAFDATLREEQTYVNIEKVIFKAMAKELVDRYQSMNQLKDALMHAVERGAKGLSTTTGMMPFSTSIAPGTESGTAAPDGGQTRGSPSTSLTGTPALTKPGETASHIPITSLFSGPSQTEQKLLQTTGPIKLPRNNRLLIFAVIAGLICAGAGTYFYFNYEQSQPVRDQHSDRLFAEATTLFREGKYGDALRKAKVARELAQVKGQETDKSEDVLPLMAQIYLAQGDTNNSAATNLTIISRENAQSRDLSAARIAANRRLARSALLGGDVQTARRFNQRAISLIQRAYGYDGPALFEPYLLQAEIEILDGKLAEAKKVFEWLSKHKSEVDGKTDDGGARYLRDQANFALANGEAQDAEQLARDGLKIMEATYGAGNPECSSYQDQLAEALLAQHKLEESEKYVRQARQSLEEAVGKKNVRLIPVIFTLAKIRLAHNDLDGAGHACERMLEIGSPVLYDTDYRMAKVRALFKTILEKKANPQPSS
jgi:serine/threonine protein kinase